MGLTDWLAKGAQKLLEPYAQAFDAASQGAEATRQAVQSVKPRAITQVDSTARTVGERIKAEVAARQNPFDSLLYLTEAFYGELFSYREGAKLGVLVVRYKDGNNVWQLELEDPDTNHIRLTDNHGVLVENVSLASSSKSFIVTGYGDTFLPFGFGKLPQQVNLTLKALSGGVYPGGYSMEELLENTGITAFGEFLTLLKKVKTEGVDPGSVPLYVALWYLFYDGAGYLFVPTDWSRSKVPNDPYFEYVNLRGLVLYKRKFGKAT
jgi:hypothetical protein